VATGFTIELVGGVHRLKGSFDEASHFDALIATPLNQPLRLNLAGIQTINSLGLRRLLMFARALLDRPVEIYDCPPVFIEAINVMPLAIGGPQYVNRVRSLLLPFHCRADHDAVFSVKIEDIKVTGGEVLLPSPPCATCHQPMEPDLETDLDEFFCFLSQ
jgi:hypothetical protein